MTAVVRGTGVGKRWGKTLALDGASFEIGHGVTGLLGANGAGKTTLLGLVLGLHRPDSGTLEVLGRDPSRAGPEVRARLGYTPEHEALPPDVRAHDLVRHIAEIHGLPRRDATGRANDALWLVGLAEERFRPIGTMSTGQRQRVKLAQALAHDPELLLLDEPTNGLDPVQRDQMLELIGRIGAELAIDVVLSSHLLDEVESVSDAVVILDEGRVVAEGRMDELGTAGAELVVDLDATSTAANGLAKTLRAKRLKATSDGSRVRVELTKDRDYDIVRDALADAGVGVRRLAPRRSSLEDVYLEAAGR